MFQAGHLKMLDGYIDFFMDPSLSECYLQLKEELDKLIQQKLEDPNFDIHKEGKYILFAVQELAAGDLCEGRFVFGRETSRARLRSPEDDDKSNLIKDGMNPKSLLHTLLMRAGHTPPRYKTKHLKTNEFRAVVEFKGMQFVGKPKRNKQLAERDAAIEALGWLTQTSGVNAIEALERDAMDQGILLCEEGVDFVERSARLGHARIAERGRRGHPVHWIWAWMLAWIWCAEVVAGRGISQR
ncbi:DExH-box ATP-dependent RNA helicase DExH3 [Zea mays]|uniref:DExH-box ATP-dependent RNA helicase DExH3 n=1 Tax=Zea mays TaxID=4577 RepID=A0A3L6EDZ4_MAIZE|nr:DExH-box ATP-dependent RNA helicase DExH3 [Zea mays]